MMLCASRHGLKCGTVVLRIADALFKVACGTRCDNAHRGSQLSQTAQRPWFTDHV